MKVINAKVEDLKEIINIRHHAFLHCAPGFYNPIEVQNLLGDYDENEILWMIDNKNIFVCEKDGEIIGTAGWKDEYIRHVYIRPDFIGSGIGKRLLAHAEVDYMNRTQKGYIKAGVILYAKGFYEKSGFYVVSKEKDWDGSEYYLMRKDFQNIIGECING